MQNSQCSPAGGSKSQTQYRLLMSAEIDCIDGPRERADDISKFVELKTVNENAVIDGYQNGGGAHGKGKKGGNNQQIDFKFFRKMDWWLHCHLASTQRLCVGVRSTEGYIHNSFLFFLESSPKSGYLSRLREI